ncbi:MAG TPA: methionyl-tRNA formyltransferase [bacterium]|nr:methionyl-tRNA formyltransferase [bacterium]
MRIIFMGTPEFAADSLRAIIKAGMDVQAVVTQPDRPKGRGNLLIPSPVKSLALEAGIRILQPARAEESAEILREIAPDFIVVVAFGQILRRVVLDIPRKATVNVHASLLPKLRGASPINRAIINGDKETGVTTMLLDEGMDTGNMLLKEKTPILQDDTASALHDRLAEIGSRLIVETLNNFDSITPAPQNESEATYAPKLTREDGMIKWSSAAVEIRNLVRGCDPWPAASTWHNGAALKILHVDAIDSAPTNAAPGEIIEAAGGSLIVAAGSGAVSIREIQREGKKRQPVESFLRGYSIKTGDRFLQNA